MSSRETIPHTTEHDWLARRRADVTSTDAAALCGVSTRKSRWQLWREKRGDDFGIEETAAMRLGKRLETPIAEHIAAEEGFDIEPMKEYMRMPDVRLASSFDFRLRDRSSLFEIKLVGPAQFREGWRITDFGLEAPVEIEAQIQQQMLVAEIPVALIGVLVGTEYHLLRRELDDAVAQKLVAEAAQFWVEPEPAIDFAVDHAFVTRLYAQSSPGKAIAASPELADLIADYDELGRDARMIEDRRDELRARIYMAAGDAERIECEGFYALAKTGKDVTVKEHVRKASRSLRVYGREK